MKYVVKFACGHEQEVELVGSYKDRERKIRWYEENGVCSDCYAAQKSAEMSKDFDEVEMSYRDYKTNYEDCKTKKDSYDKSTKTIVVYVPKTVEEPVVEEVAESVESDDVDESSEARKVFKKSMIELVRDEVKIKKEYDDIQKSINDAEYKHDLYNLLLSKNNKSKNAGDAFANMNALMSIRKQYIETFGDEVGKAYYKEDKKSLVDVIKNGCDKYE